MKKNTFFVLMLLFCLSVLAQSTINITTSGGSFTGEKWVSITTEVDGGGTQVFGQGNGTQCDGSGLINQDVNLAPGTYYVNCYDQYADGWDGTLISVTAYGMIIGDNGGASPNDGEDNDANGTCEGTPEELEVSFQIVVPSPPSCPPVSSLQVSNVNENSAEFMWATGGSETAWEYALQLASDPTPTSGTAISMSSFVASGLAESTDYTFYVRANCGSEFSVFNSLNFSTTAPQVSNNFISGAIPITPSAEGTGCATAQFTIDFAATDFITTDSGLDGSCNNTDTGKDQFFTWTATTDALNWTDAAPGNPGIVIRDATGVEITCAPTFSPDDPTTLSGWTIGDDLIIQIYDFGTSNSEVAFCLEEFNLPTAPDCAEAPIMPMNNAIDIDASTGTVTFNWTAPSSGGAPTDYEFFLGTESGNLTSIGTLGNNDTTVDINNISANTTYYWQVIPENAGGFASGCPEWTFTTQAVAPPTTIASFNINGCGDFDSVSQAFGIGEVYWVEVIYDGNCDALVMDTGDSTTTGTLDTEIGLYDSNGNLIGSNDDFTGISPFSLFRANALPAGTYYIAASAFNTTFGQPFNVTTTDATDTGTLVFNVYTEVPNDDCGNAEAITLGTEVTGSNTGATDSSITADCFTGNVRDIWYSFVAGVEEEVFIDITSGFQYGVYSDCAGTLVGSCNTNIVTGLTEGDTYYFRITDDGTGTTRTSGAFSFTVSGTALSTGNFDEETNFTYYPNPVKNMLTLNAQKTIENLTMYNMLGQEVIRLTPNTINSEVDMSKLSSGAYFVKVTILGNTETIRIIKQ